MAKSSIEWTEMTWNPTTGCTKISAGCKNCYAEVMTRRLKAMGNKKYAAGFNKVKTHPKTLLIPYTWKNKKMIFVNSMSDLFHDDIPISFIKEVFRVMNENNEHIFQVLTKRAERLFDLYKELKWTDNIWMGVTVESIDEINRISYLQKTNAKIKFISFEPLLEDLKKLNLNKIDWVIVGGESGFNARPMNPEWVKNIQSQCKEKKVPFFFKQWGGKNKKAAGRLLNGKLFNEMPKIKKVKSTKNKKD
jgi:protein gp37